MKSVRKFSEVVENLSKMSKEEVLAGCTEIEILEEIADDEK